MHSSRRFGVFLAVASAAVLFFPAAYGEDVESESPSYMSVPEGELLDYLADPSVFTLIDARTAEEFASAHIEGAVNIPHDSPEETLAGISDDKTAPIVVYCRTGSRAGRLRERLMDSGYSNIRILGPRQILWSDGFATFNCGVPGTDAAAAPATLMPAPKEAPQ